MASFLNYNPSEFQLNAVIEGCVRKVPSSQKALLEYYYGLAKKICLRYASGMEEAEEMVDDGFLKIFDKINDFDLTMPFEPWLRRIMINTAIDHFRKKSHRIVTEELNDECQISIEASQISSLSATDLLVLIQKLPPVYRIVFNLSAIEGYDHAFVAKQLGIAESTSRSNLAKARHKLQQWVIQLFDQQQNQSNSHVFA